MQHHYNVNKHDFFNLARVQNIQNKIKCDNTLCFQNVTQLIVLIFKIFPMNLGSFDVTRFDP
jgi:hypothetical protein